VWRLLRAQFTFNTHRENRKRCIMPYKKFRQAPWTAGEKEKAGQAINDTICKIEGEMEELEEMIEQTKEFVAARLESKNPMGMCERHV